MAPDPRISPAPQVPAAADGVVCPFCAHIRGVREANAACPKCTMEDTVGTRRSTGERIGPWFVLQRKNPTAPGLKFSVLLTLARRGHVTAKSIVRGPTTGQLWRFASEVKGLSRMFGICWHCKASVSPDATTCPKCKSAQEIPDDPDVFLESHSSLPLMRELPANVPGNGFSSGEPIAAAPISANLPAAPRRDREPTRRPPAAGGLDDLADLTRALAIQRPAEPERLPRRLGANELREISNSGNEPILSASDLATAFQLGGSRPGVLGRARGAAWMLIKVAFVLAIVLGLAGLAIGYMKPAWKQVALDRAKPYLDRAGTWWTEAYTVVVGTPSKEPSPADEADRLDDTQKPDAPVSNEVVPPTTPIKLDDGSTAAKTDEKTNTSVVSDRSPSVVDVTPTVKIEPESIKPEPAKVEPMRPEVAKADPPVQAPKVETPKKDPKNETPQTNGGRELTLDEAIAQANELRNSALDAEARKDWRAAVVIYEQIGTLPEEARPSDLKVRLALAREQLAKQ
jgi:hypothetical protein